MHHDPSAWTFGWDAIGAIFGALASLGAVGVAYLTVGMARSAQASAQAASDAARAASDEAAGAWRPLILLDGGSLSEPVDGRATMRLDLSNDGRGPALSVRFALTVYGDPQKLNTEMEVGGAVTSRAVVKDGAKVDLHLPTEQGITHAQLNVTYADLGGRRYFTSARLNISRERPTMSSSQLKAFRLHFNELAIGQGEPTYNVPANAEGPAK